MFGPFSPAYMAAIDRLPTGAMRPRKSHGCELRRVGHRSALHRGRAEPVEIVIMTHVARGRDYRRR